MRMRILRLLGILWREPEKVEVNTNAGIWNSLESRINYLETDNHASGDRSRRL